MLPLKPLPEKWKEFLNAQPETAMDAQVGDVILKDGTVVPDVVFSGGSFISEVRGQDAISFDPNDIAEIRLTHKRWRFR